LREAGRRQSDPEITAHRMTDSFIGAAIGSPVPTKAGIGLRAQHHLTVLSDSPAAAWFEAHTENYFADGGAHVDALTRIRANYPLSLHGVGLSLGSADPLDVLHLSARIAQAQDFLGRRILIENVSSYLQFECSRMPEWEFVAGVAAESGCGILLDLNNIYVAARNFGFEAQRYLDAIDPGAVQEIHLAGHSAVAFEGQELLIDTHGTPVCDAVWSLYRTALRRFGDVPTLIEWDTDIPALEVLMAEAAKADAVGAEAHALAA